MKKMICTLAGALLLTSLWAQYDRVDYRYAPQFQVSTPAFPDDTCKTLVGPLGQLFYEFGGGFYPYIAMKRGFRTVIQLLPDEGVKIGEQRLRSARVPIVETGATLHGMTIRQEAFSLAADYMERGVSTREGNREDIILITVTNPTSSEQTLRPVLIVNSQHPVSVQDGQVIIESQSVLRVSEPIQRVRKNLASFKTLIELAPVSVPAGDSVLVAGMYDNGKPSRLAQRFARSPRETLRELPSLRERVAEYWESGTDIPYGHIRVPDAEIQNLVDASIRGIWQAREIRDGRYCFQVGPTEYRGLWIVDGAFLLETATLLGKGEEARDGIEYTLSFQKENGAFAKLDSSFYKENGLVLWTCVRHAMLTQDRDWLRSVWGKLSQTIDRIGRLRAQTLANDNPLDDGLIPPGFIDGGLKGGPEQAEYSNVVWNLSGMKAMIQAAHWLGEKKDAQRWQQEYDDFYAAFRRAAERDKCLDSFGNTYLPVVMDPQYHSLPQRAQWAFCQSIYPGQIFGSDDPLALGTLEMLHTTLQEGMVMGTGWIISGIWNYFASFYGHACQWMGQSDRAAEALYAFANHASPLYLWREEHNPRDLQPINYIGDMPHNWASAEFIRMVTHMLAIDRGNELHLLEAIPRQWLKAGMSTALSEIATPFGPLSFTLNVDRQGRTARLRIEPLSDPACREVAVHLAGWARCEGRDQLTLKPSKAHDLLLELQ